jgi:hypothetical protein
VDHVDPRRPPSWLELESIRPLRPDVEKITSLHRDTIKNAYGAYVVKMAERREGMKLKHALGIADGTLPRRARPPPRIHR